MPKRQRRQKQDGELSSPPTANSTGEERRRVTEAHENLENDALNEEENPEATSSRSSGLKSFLKHAKNQQYRVVETRVALVCCFGVFFKLIYSEDLEELDGELFTTHAAITYAGRECRIIKNRINLSKKELFFFSHSVCVDGGRVGLAGLLPSSTQ